ncbi:unnamed protein product [Paramecium sonneborni]|uniref:Uncharacterized protein n=1 Tax=Paramecium sonneborni TaxID=65129 RepID=A0A8S1QSS4_9CILI|nr:unnamed protein product [Paramecium sonneborni]
MYNRPNSKQRYQQDPNIDQINLKEKQLYLQSSSINPLTGAVLRSDQYQSYNQTNQNNHNLDKKIALQTSSINPLTGEPLIRNAPVYQSESHNSKYAPYGTSANAGNYTTSAGQIGAPHNSKDDPQFQRNLIKFFAADDPNQIQPKHPKKTTNPIPSDPSFQRNLVKFFAADDPSSPHKANNHRPNQSRSNQLQQQSYPQQSQTSNLNNNQQFQSNLNKFFAADDPTIIKKSNQHSNQDKSYQQSRHQSNQFQEANFNNNNDPQFEKNLIKFFAADDPSQPKKIIHQQTQQQQQINLIEQNKLSRLEQDPRFQKNLQQFFGIDGGQQPFKGGQGVQGAIQQINKTNKVIAITDSSSAARNQVAAFFRTRGIDDFDVFTVPGGVFGLQNNQIWESSLKYYMETMNAAYDIREIYILSVLDNNTNAKIYVNVNDKRSHQIAISDFKTILETRLNIQHKLNGIIIDQRGASEKVF